MEPNEQLRGRAAAEGVTALASLDDCERRRPTQSLSLTNRCRRNGRRAGLPGRSRGCCVISVAAGVTIERIAAHSGRAVSALSAPCKSAGSDWRGHDRLLLRSDGKESQRRLAEELMSCVGRTLFVSDENLMDAVTAFRVPAPPIFFPLREALTALQRLRTEEDVASHPANAKPSMEPQAVISSGTEPSELRASGDTRRAQPRQRLNDMRDDVGLTAIVIEAVQAAKARSIELRSPKVH